MPASPQAYYRPTSLDEALKLLSRPDHVPLAGGTSLLASEEGLPVAGVVDLQGLGLNQVRPTADGTLLVGAMVRLADLAEQLNGDPATLLRGAIQLAGPNTYRHAATVGGTIASRLPDSEWLAALLALGASVTTDGPTAMLSVADYLAAAQRPAGLITSLTLPMPGGKGHSERVARTPADYPIVSVTGWREPSGAIRLAATGLAPLPVCLGAAESALAGGLTEGNIEAAATAAAKSTTHPGDFRGSAAYRADMAAVLTRRVLRALG